jgi:hypothetical protein
MKAEEIPESEVQVKIARCPKCKNPVKHLHQEESPLTLHIELEKLIENLSK